MLETVDAAGMRSATADAPVAGAPLLDPRFNLVQRRAPATLFAPLHAVVIRELDAEGHELSENDGEGTPMLVRIRTHQGYVLSHSSVSAVFRHLTVHCTKAETMLDQTQLPLCPCSMHVDGTV
jgi:hypothetical protein